MKIIKLALLLALPLLPSSHAQEARFFRIAGPVASTITALSADGYVTWTNAPTNSTFTVQTAQALLDQTETIWVDYIQVPITNSVTTHWLYDPHSPTNMALIPAGSFTMGDTFDDGEDAGGHAALPLHTVHVSAFYMDKYEVTKALWDIRVIRKPTLTAPIQARTVRCGAAVGAAKMANTGWGTATSSMAPRATYNSVGFRSVLPPGQP